MTVARMNSPPFKVLFEVERSLSLDTFKHLGYITELMRGSNSRFAHWLNALKIDLHTNNIETCKLRRISYTLDKCARLFENVQQEWTAVVVNVPTTFGRVWRQVRRTPFVVNPMLEPDVRRSLQIAIQGSRLTPDTTFIVMTVDVFDLIRRYLQEIPQDHAFFIAHDQTYWVPTQEYIEYMVAASTDGWVRYTPLHELSNRVALIPPKDTERPMPCSHESFSRIRSCNETILEVPPLEDESKLRLSQQIQHHDYSVVPTHMGLPASNTPCAGPRSDHTAEFVPFRNNDRPLTVC